MNPSASFEIQSSRESVELWLSQRLPFQPNGSLLDARNRLREALGGLATHGDGGLIAEYVSARRGVFDLENVLFYNVGTGAFARLTREGLHASRSHGVPPRTRSGRSFEHYHRYTLGPIPEPDPDSGPELSFALPTVTSATKTHEVWWAASAGSGSGVSRIPGAFSLFIEAPTGSRNIASILKPLIDGIVSAMHPGMRIQGAAVERLVQATHWPRQEILRRLETPAASILPEREVLRPYRDFIQWNPADELCDEFSVVPVPADQLCRVRIRRRK